jgi:hypothetical protein
MAALNPMVLNKIDSMDLSKERKELIKTLFENQLRIGSDPKTKQNRVTSFRESLKKGLRNENH